MLVDCHMHTPLCGHAGGEPREYVRAAARKGIDLITFTCHIPLLREDLFRGRGIRMSKEDLPHYFELLEDAAQEGKKVGVRVLKGIEAEVYPEKEPLEGMEEVLDSWPFDFVLGSLHHPLPGYRSWLQGKGMITDEAIVDTYFGHLAAGARSGIYNSMSHPDVIRIYGTVQRFEPEEHEPAIRQFLEALVESDTCMEVNTSGLIKGVYKLHPDPVILDWASAMGVRLTIGSDAHQPEQVGQHFDTVLPLLKKKGFTHVHYFEKRKAVPVEL